VPFFLFAPLLCVIKVRGIDYVQMVIYAVKLKLHIGTFIA